MSMAAWQFRSLASARGLRRALFVGGGDVAAGACHHPVPLPFRRRARGRQAAQLFRAHRYQLMALSQFRYPLLSIPAPS